MRTTLILIFIFFVCLPSFSQYSENYKTLTKNVSAIDTLDFKEYYNNGQLKEKGTLLTYEIGNDSIYFYSGDYYQYFRNGNVKMKAEFDPFGNMLSATCYIGFEELWSETTTLEIDTITNDIESLFLDDDNTILISHDRFYSYSLKLDKMYLKKEGKMIGNKKIGVWKIYSRDGELVMEKLY